MEGSVPVGSTGDVVSTPPSRRCTTCGAPVRFDPGSADLWCKHCHGSEAIDGGGPAPGELDYAAAVGDDASTADELEEVELQCSDCGAPSAYSPNIIAASCPYCRTPFVGAPASTRTIRPTGVVPLAITEDRAREITKLWLGSRWFAPRHLGKVATSALHSGYTPAWVFSMDTTAGYRGRRGDNYLDTETYTTTDANGNSSTQTRTVTKIRWHAASGTVHLRFSGVTAFAGTDPVSRFGEDLEPFGDEHVRAYADDYLRGTTAYAYTKPPAAGLERARVRTTGALEAEIRAHIGGDHQEIHHVDRRDRNIGVRYHLLPGWEATYRHRDDSYELAVNGVTGEIDGTRPYSKVKIAIAVGFAIAAIALVVFLVMRSQSGTSVPAPTPPTTGVVPTTRPSSTTEAITPTTTSPPLTTSPVPAVETIPITDPPPEISPAPTATPPSGVGARAPPATGRPTPAVAPARDARADPVSTEALPVDHPLLAVFAPPRVPRLLARLGLGHDEPIAANFTGWCKLVLLTDALAICVPRDHTLVEPMRREIAALELVTRLGVPSVPTLREVIEDAELSPLPIMVCERLPGIPLADVLDEVDPTDLAELFGDLGRRTARWHDASTAEVATLPRRDGFSPVARFAAALDLSGDERRWSDRAATIADGLDRVLVHGDIHEGQLLVHDASPHVLTGILDWQTARVDHPFVDFDLGEWGTAMWRGRRRSFAELRRRSWTAYATERSLGPDVGAAFEWFQACSHARRLFGDGRFPVVHPPDVVGTADEARAAITAALRDLAALED